MKHTTDKKLLALRRNIVAAIILAAFIPAAIVLWVVHLHLDAAFTALTHENLQSIVERHSLRIDSFIEERGSNILLTTVAAAGDRLLDPIFFANQLRYIQNKKNIAIVDMGLVDKNGQQRVYAGPYNLNLANYADADWFKEISANKNLNSANVYISDVFLGLRRSPHFIIAIPIELEGERWFFRATVDFADFSHLASDIRAGDFGKAAILNHAGEYQTPPFENPNETGQSLLAKAQNIFGKDFNNTTKHIIEENNFIYAMAPLKNNQWMLIIRIANNDAYSLINESRKALLIVLTLVSFAMLGAGIFLSWHLLNRIAKLEKEREALNQHLIQAGKLSALGEMAAGIAHEINNPIAAMLEESGWIEDIVADMPKDGNTDEITKSIATIRAQGGRCRSITHKLLGFARKSDEPDQLVIIKNLLTEMISLTDQKARDAKVNLSLTIQPNLPPIKSTSSVLQQVFLNLLNNAIDATEGKGHEVYIKAELDKQNRGIIIAIIDDGPGISEQIKAKIFDPFFTTKSAGKGTGLGLSICYGIVKGLGGEIMVESEEGMGAKFEVLLPFAEK